MTGERNVTDLSARISASNLIIAILRVTLLALYLRVLGPSAYGQFSSILISVSFPMMVLGMFPFGRALLHFSTNFFDEKSEEEFYRKAKVIFILNLLCSLALVGLFLLFHSPFFSEVLNKPDLDAFWPWAMAILVISTFNILHTLFLATGIVEKSYTIKIATMSLQFVVSLVLIYRGALDVTTLLMLHTATILGELLLHATVARAQLSRIASKKVDFIHEAREIAVPTAAESSKYLNTVARKLIDVFAVRYSPYEIITYYRIFRMLFDHINMVVFDPLMQAFFTFASKRIIKDPGYVATTTSVIVKVPFTLFFLLFLGSMLMHGYLVKAISLAGFNLNAEVVAGAIHLVLLLDTFFALGYLMGMVPRVLKKPHALVWCSVAYFLSNLAGFVVVFLLPQQVISLYGPMIVFTIGHVGLGLYASYLYIFHFKILDRELLVFPGCGLLTGLAFVLPANPLYLSALLFFCSILIITRGMSPEDNRIIRTAIRERGRGISIPLSEFLKKYGRK